jgi:hypothetical protein
MAREIPFRKAHDQVTGLCISHNQDSFPGIPQISKSVLTQKLAQRQETSWGWELGMQKDIG